jgi:hypothetical protein
MLHHEVWKVRDELGLKLTPPKQPGKFVVVERVK